MINSDTCFYLIIYDSIISFGCFISLTRLWTLWGKEPCLMLISFHGSGCIMSINRLCLNFPNTSEETWIDEVLGLREKWQLNHDVYPSPIILLNKEGHYFRRLYADIAGHKKEQFINYMALESGRKEFESWIQFPALWFPSYGYLVK